MSHLSLGQRGKPGRYQPVGAVPVADHSKCCYHPILPGEGGRSLRRVEDRARRVEPKRPNRSWPSLSSLRLTPRVPPVPPVRGKEDSVGPTGSTRSMHCLLPPRSRARTRAKDLVPPGGLGRSLPPPIVVCWRSLNAWTRMDSGHGQHTYSQSRRVSSASLVQSSQSVGHGQGGPVFGWMFRYRLRRPGDCVQARFDTVLCLCPPNMMVSRRA